MSEWKEYKLGDIIQFGNGKVRPKTDGAYPIYGGNGILGYGDTFNYEGESVIIGRVGAYCGSVYYENAPIWVSDNALAAKPKCGFCTKFLYYFLRNMRLNEFAEGSSHPLVTQTLLNSIDVVVTDDISEQERIAGILSSLDDKIELLGNQNRTLEELAQTLFRHHFIENPNPDWADVKLGDVIKSTSGGTPSRKIDEYYIGGTINWVKSKELLGSYIFDTEETITDDAVANSSAKMLLKNSVLIAMYGATVGEYGIIAQPMTCNQAVCALIPNEIYPYTYLLSWVKDMQEEFINLACGAAQQNISQAVIKEQFVSGDKIKIAEFHNEVVTCFSKIRNNQEQIMSLTKLRDTLLPKLMSNEIKI